MTMPKQWYSGTGMHRRSSGVRRIASPTKKPLFRMLRWVSVAPLGKPVVPEVNWMLIGSVGESVGPMAASCSCCAAPASAGRSSKPSMPGVCSAPRRMAQRRWGRAAACNWPGAQLSISGTRLRRISM
ncbi:hypothetical protein D9M68_903100 [compost metagenome]